MSDLGSCDYAMKLREGFQARAQQGMRDTRLRRAAKTSSDYEGGRAFPRRLPQIVSHARAFYTESKNSDGWQTGMQGRSVTPAGSSWAEELAGARRGRSSSRQRERLCSRHSWRALLGDRSRELRSLYLRSRESRSCD